jgi:hypothetical protein
VRRATVLAAPSPMVLAGPGGAVLWGLPPTFASALRRAHQRADWMTENAVAAVGHPGTAFPGYMRSDERSAEERRRPPHEDGSYGFQLRAYGRALTSLLWLVAVDVALTVWIASGFVSGTPREGAGLPPRLASEVESGEIGQASAMGGNWMHMWALPYGGASLPLVAPAWKPDLVTLYGIYVGVPLVLHSCIAVSALAGWNWALELWNTMLALWAVLSPLRAPALIWCLRVPFDLLVAIAVRELIRTIEPAHALARRRHLVNFV